MTDKNCSGDEVAAHWHNLKKYRLRTVNIDNLELVLPCGSHYGHTAYTSETKERTDRLIECEACGKYHVLRISDYKGNILIEWLQ